MVALFRRRSRESISVPVTPANTPEASAVVETLRNYPLDPEEVMLVGSAALALYGVALSSYNDSLHINGPPRPNDIDFNGTVDYMEELYNEGNGTLNGVPVEHKVDHAGRHTILRIESNPLPIDIISRYHAHSLRSHREFSDKVRKYNQENSRPIEGLDGIHVASLRVLERDLREKKMKLNPKATRDHASLDRFIRDQKRTQ